MKTALVSTPEVLDALDRGRDRGPIERAVILLGLALGGGEWRRLLEVDVAARDRALFALRAQMFGARLELTARCPKCQELLESEIDLGALLGAPRAPEAEAEIPNGVRLPNSADLLAAAACKNADEARALLVARCVSGVASTEPMSMLETLARRDPAADVELAFECVACGSAFARPLDIASYLWSELEVWAELLLDEVHALARAYGWREHEILALSPRRRRAYLDRVLT